MMETKYFLVVIACVLHLVPVLVSDAVVDSFELDFGKEF
jgi:hypothetical protein